MFPRIDVSNECADLPPLQNGEMQCTVEDYGKKCLLKCKNGYAMPGIGVQTYQLCTSGVWDYEKHGKELPECEGKYIHVNEAHTVI